MLTSYEEWFGVSGEGKHQLAALRLLGFFNGPAPISALATLRREPIQGLNDGLVAISDANWSRLLEFLQELRLIKLTEKWALATRFCRNTSRNGSSNLISARNGQLPVGRRAVASSSIIIEVPRMARPWKGRRDQRLFLAIRYGCQARRYMEAFITYLRDIQKGSPRLALSRRRIEPIFVH